MTRRMRCSDCRRSPTDGESTVAALPWSTLPSAGDEDDESDEV